MSFDTIDRQFRKPQTSKLECLGCSTTNGVEMENSRTQYHWEGDWDDPENPNRPIPLCRLCAAEHHLHWDYMWAEYRVGLL